MGGISDSRSALTSPFQSRAHRDGVASSDHSTSGGESSRISQADTWQGSDFLDRMAGLRPEARREGPAQDARPGVRILGTRPRSARGAAAVDPPGPPPPPGPGNGRNLPAPAQRPPPAGATRRLSPTCHPRRPTWVGPAGGGVEKGGRKGRGGEGGRSESGAV